MVWAWMVLFVILGWFGLDWLLSFLDGLGLIGSCHCWMFRLGWFCLSFLDGLGLVCSSHSWMVIMLKHI